MVQKHPKPIPSVQAVADWPRCQPAAFARDNGETASPSKVLIEELCCRFPPATVGDLAKALHDRAFGLVLLVSALPGIVPAPPGYGLIAGLLPLLLGFQMMLGRCDPLLPRFIARRQIGRKELDGILRRALPWVRRVERMGRPRFGWHLSGAARRLVGAFVLVLALAVAVPLPLSNALPAAGIAIIAISLSQRDGLIAAAGVLVGVFGLAVTIGVSAGLAGFVASFLL